MKLTVIYLTYNEKDSISRNLRMIYENFKKIKINPEVLVIDDSKDGSETILKKEQLNYKTLRLIHRINKRGPGSATREGIINAKGDYIIVSMFDSPQEIMYFPAIIKKFEEGYDLVHTSRFMGGTKIVGYPLKKLIANRICNNLVSLLFWRFDLKDFTSLFKGFKKKPISKLDLEANEFDLGLEIATKSIRKGYKITEVPVDWIERDVGKSKLILRKQIPNYLKRLINVWLFYRR